MEHPRGVESTYANIARTPSMPASKLTEWCPNSNIVASAIGDVHISNDCPLGIANYNAYVMGAMGDSSSTSPDINLCNLNCTSGSGAGDFEKLCSYSCGLGYCPKGACYCTGMGKAKVPKVSGPVGYPIAGADANYEGLCNFACVYGYCPPEHVRKSPFPTSHFQLCLDILCFEAGRLRFIHSLDA